MKKLYLLLLLTIIPLLAHADAVEINGIYYNLVEKAKVAEVTKNPNNYSGDIVIPEKVTYDGVEYDVTSICDMAFLMSYITSVSVPNSVTNIGFSAFYSCKKLISVTIPNSITAIPQSLFEYCENLSSLVIPNSITKIGPYAFGHCSSLSSITIPNTVISIGSAAFQNCISLTSVTIPNSITSMGVSIFNGCGGLTSVTIGSGVNNLYNKAFANCSSLLDVYCLSEGVPSTDTDVFENSYPETITLHVPEGCVDAYKAVDPWSGFKEIVSITETNYNLIYMVDEVEYKTYQLKEGAAITPEPAPTKEGFVFSGWSEIPATMPAHDVTIYGTFTSASEYDAVKIGDSGYGTFCSTSDLDFTDVDGLKAYTATGYDDDNGSIWLTRVYHVPAGIGLIVKGTPGITYQVPHKSTHSYYSNMLVGNTGPTITINETDGDKTNYYLKSGKLLRVVGSATIGQYKSYLQVPTSVFARTRSLDFILDDESGTTYVPHIVQPEQGRDVYYNLQGQRVDKPTKGLYIKNGKKVVIK